MKKILYILFLLISCSSFLQLSAQHNIAIRLGANCTNQSTVFSNYTNFTEGTTYTVADWTLPSNYSLVQPLYNALKGSTFLLQLGALTEDIQIDWVLWNINCSNGVYLPNGSLTQTVFNGYFVVYHKVGGVWTPLEPYPFSGGKKAVLSLKNTLAFQTLLTGITGGALNLAFTYFVNNTFDPTGLTLTAPTSLTDTSQFWVVTAAHFSNLIGGNKNQITGINDPASSVPTSYDLTQNYPNPFNPSTIIQYSIPVRTIVELSVFNILGVKVASLVNSVKEAGTYSVQFDASKLGSGLYIYELRTNNFNLSRKMLLLK